MDYVSFFVAISEQSTNVGIFIILAFIIRIERRIYRLEEIEKYKREEKELAG